MRSRPPSPPRSRAAALLTLLSALLLQACLSRPTVHDLLSSRTTYDRIERQWRRSLGDPELDADLERSYLELQRDCRRLHRSGGPMSAEMRETCAPVERPWSIRHNELVTEKDDLARSLFEVDSPGTLANNYIRWPSRRNEERLRKIFKQVNRYSVPPLSWYMYRQRPEFQRARAAYFTLEWESLRETLRAVEAGQQPADVRERIRLTRRTAFAFHRLKEELKANQGLEASLVGPLTLARTMPDYERELEAENAAMEARRKAGRKKEVVIFIHGIADDRPHWQAFPKLLAREDMEDPSIDRWFRVYNYRYDTRDNHRSLMEFAREFEAFLREVRAKEEVDGVNVVAHSMGGVVSLRALINATRGTLPETTPLALNDPPAHLAARALEAVRNSGPPLIKRLITLASPYHGDELANLVLRATVPQPKPFRRYPQLPWRVPYFSTQQTDDMQVGGFHLRSISRLDTEWVLNPAGLVPFLEQGVRARLGAQELAQLERARIRAMAVIAVPRLQSFRQLEDDGLVRAYAANPRHHFLWGPDASIDLGFSGGEVRYLGTVHSGVKTIQRRNDPTYRHVLAFLRDTPLPQEQPEQFGLKRFLAMLRAFPGDVPEGDRPLAFFHNQPRTVYIRDKAVVLPKLSITWEESDVSRKLTTWNPETGLVAQAGMMPEEDQARVVHVTLSADGYLPKRLALPIRAGQVTYAIQVVLEREVAPVTSR